MWLLWNWVLLLTTVRAAMLGNAKCNDVKLSCPDNTTCCLMATKEYGCCPMPSAVCCSDGLHCCPSNSKCDQTLGTCIKQDTVLRFFGKDEDSDVKVSQAAKIEPLHPHDNIIVFLSDFQKNSVPMEKFRSQPTTCPDGKSECPSGTCCMLRSGQYGCCDLQDAVCCDDGVHCCPQDFTCDVEHRSCKSVRLGVSISWVDKKPSIAHPVSVQADPPISCRDNKTFCEQNDTCCNITKGFGCCPLKDAVCCLDGMHCCPFGTHCDIPNRRCYKSDTNWEQPWVDRPPLKRNYPLIVNIEADKEPQNGNPSLVLNEGPSNVVGVEKISAVICPDGQMCADGQTCCQMSDESYGCCSYSDNLDVNSVSKIIISGSYKNQTSVICPGGKAECSDGETCCMLESGNWGCCPQPQAVCCSDHIHCCPEGFRCDIPARACKKAEEGIPWSEKQHAIHSASVVPVTDIFCPDGSPCSDNNTCCKLKSGDYGCCPVPKAVCCSDLVHCCPEGYICNEIKQSCEKSAFENIWLVKKQFSTVLTRLLVQTVVCPDQSECPDGNTCCQLSSGSYGCCPLPKAVCCSDEVHCCPSGTTCDVAEGKCLKGKISTPWLEKHPAVQRLSVQNVVCPDQTSACPDDNTCCLMSSGSYGCCPLPKAVCCSDEVHCCPSGTTCDVAEGKCLKGEITTPWLEKHPAVQRLMVQDVVCPDQTSECPDGNTCCMMSSGSYGCCPLPKAVCCSDEVHCCPSGTTCDVAEGKCLKGEISTPWLEKHPAVQRLSVQNVVCPDQTSACPDDNTCCLMSSGSYGCCPLPQAVCCSDEVHCCPSGTTCDVAEGKCLKGEISTSWLEKHPAVQRLSVQDVVCPDQTSECPDGNTCCMMSSGSYGCCPLPKAVCCSDEVHCCPSGTTCDMAEGKCLKGEISTPWLEKHPAVQRLSVQNVVCPDQTSECPDGNTCCLLSSGNYGCCPLPKAVCCSDDVHCCPSGTTCDVAEGKCLRGKISTPWLEKQPAVQRLLMQGLMCGDGKTECPNGNTCCNASSGGYGCCPLPEAVCCNDKLHCCPQGYTCNDAEGSCRQGEISTPWLEKQPAIQRMKARNIICPDQQSECPDGNTCCKMQSGQYGCCPQPEAVCCSDGLHCCSKGYQCDTKSGQCFKEQNAIAWQEKLPSLQRDLVGTVYCPDFSQCPDGNTCCKMSSGDYGCCPLPSAVCCDDGAHCCPADYTCVTATGQCIKDQQTISWVAKQNALPRLVNSIICPDKQSECQDGQTCCPLSSGGYGCCPLLKAVCCPDHLHCCPENYTCNTASGSCTLNESTKNVPWIKKVPAMTLH